MRHTRTDAVIRLSRFLMSTHHPDLRLLYAAVLVRLAGEWRLNR